jgi:hypothetical protein
MLASGRLGARGGGSVHEKRTGKKQEFERSKMDSYVLRRALRERRRKVRRKIVAIVAGALLLAGAAGAQEGFNAHLFPVVMHGPGVAPSFWQSDVFIQNPMGVALTVGFAFFPADQANEEPTTYQQTRVIPAHGSVLIPDIVYTMFNYDNKKGALYLDTDSSYFPGNPGNAWVVASTRNYNTGSDPRGTFGHALPNMIWLLNGSASSSFATGARHDSSSRCNMGIGNVSAVQVTVHYRVRGADGSVVAEGTKAVPKYSLGQWTFASLGIAPQSGLMGAEFWLDPASVTANPCANPLLTNAFFAYLSPVDGARSGEGTGDGEIIPAIPTVYPPVMFTCP